MNRYKQKKDYKVDSEAIQSILEHLSNTPYKKIFYIGYADETLVVSLKEKYEVILSDWFNRTNKAIVFWSEGMTDDGLYILDGTPMEVNIPSWASDVRVMMEGMPEHDVLILDIPVNWVLYPKNYYIKPAELVFLLGDADSSNFKTAYTWSYEGVWVGRSKKEMERENNDY